MQKLDPGVSGLPQLEQKAAAMLKRPEAVYINLRIKTAAEVRREARRVGSRRFTSMPRSRASTRNSLQKRPQVRRRVGDRTIGSAVVCKGP
jgi:hypothetical protein